MYQRRIMENKFNRHITNKQLQYKRVIGQKVLLLMPMELVKY